MAYLGNGPGVASQRTTTTVVATSGQTTFTPTSGYSLGYLDVFLNGVKLVNGSDYTASNGTTVVLVSGVQAGDSVELVAYTPRGLSDGYTKTEADLRFPVLDGTGKVASQQLPSYVDDVLEYNNYAALPATGESGKIYITLNNNKVYRWSGSVYVEIVATPGSTDSVTEGSTNLYYTNARARSSLSFTAGSGAYNSSTGVITIPTNTNQLTNGSNYITLTSLSATTASGVSYNNTTGVISLSSIPNNSLANSSITINGTSVSLGGSTTIAGGVTSVNTLTGAVTLTTANITENTNLYYTDARVATKLGTTSIDALSDVDTTTSAPTNSQALVWNSTSSKWVPGTVSATGGGSNAAFYLNDTTITTNYTIPNGQNAMTAGPITVVNNVVVTIPDGSTWTVV
ncbi:MAG: hypothetical protein EBT26_05295 [Microbacteriaceae bacterium]|nr:hypothetical protein [Microbacteriaceae bacterium]NBS61441.1 hypothetical protein [Microbacteriaceae bacterium]